MIITIFRISAFLLLAVLFSACVPKTKKQTEYVTNNDMRQFQDVNTHPAPVQKASEAVVQVSSAGGTGTGTFVSDDGLLLTNDHVLGQDNCLKDGCFANLTFNYQKGRTDMKSLLVFAQPVYVDTGADFNFFRIFHVDSNEKGEMVKSDVYKPAHFLKMAENNTINTGKSELDDYYVIGHPLGMLKKVLVTKVNSKDGHLLTFNKFLLPGNSGSALLNKDMEVVGIVHSSVFQSYAVSKNGIEGTAMGTHSSKFPLLTTVKTSNSISGIGINKFKSPEELDASDEEDLSLVYAYGKLPKHFPSKQELLKNYFVACKDELKDVDYSAENILMGEPDAPKCGAMLSLISCDYDKEESTEKVFSVSSISEEDQEHPGEKLAFCPEKITRDEIRDFIEAVVIAKYKATQRFSISNTESLLSRFYLSESEFSGMFDKFIQPMWKSVPQDFETLAAIYDSSPLKQKTLQGVGASSTLSMVREFKKYSFYSQQTMSVLVLTIHLFVDKEMTDAEMKSIWSQLKNDPKVSVMESWIIDLLDFILGDVIAEIQKQ